MKKNRLALILTFGLVFIAVLMFIFNRNNSTLNSKESDFAVDDTAIISKIFIANLDSSQILLERGPDGWRLNKKYLAQQAKVDQLLSTMKKIRVRGPVSKASHDNVIRRMSAIGIKVEVYQTAPRITLFGKFNWFPHEKRTKVYFVGDVTQDNMGTYMLLDGAKQAFIMAIPGFRGFVATRYSPIEDEWRDHSVFRKRLGEIKSIQVEFSEEPNMAYRLDCIEKNNYRITRLADNHILQQFDTLKVLNFLTSFSDVRFESLLTNNMPVVKRDSIIASPFLHRIILVDNNNDSSIVKTFIKKKFAEHLDIADKLVPVDLDRMYGLVNNDKDFVLLQSYSFDKVLRPVSYFEKKE
jgi:hypothetical protein